MTEEQIVQSPPAPPGGETTAAAFPQRESSFRALIENASDIITILDFDGTIRYESPSIERLLGYTSAELIGRNSFAYIHPDDREMVRRNFADMIENGGTNDPLEFRFQHRNGTWRILEAVANKAPDDSSISGMIVNSRDITERKLVEQALNDSVEQFRSAQKMEAVGRLAGGVAHDFNNLLTAITGYSFMIINGLGPHHPLVQKAEEIKYAAERAASLTRQLLAFSRRQVLQPKVLDLNAVVSDVEKLLRRLIGEDIALTTTAAHDLASVRADPGQLEQVILNLAINARDAMPAGGKLTIETANVELDEGYAYWHVNVAPGSYVRLSVSDNGTGMDEETRAHIFEPFFTTKEGGKGSGLGLSAVYGIVQQSGGHIYVYSEPGHGTTFKIYLPQAGAEVKAVSARTAGKESPRGSETVLLVEDEEMVRRLSCEILSLSGYRVIEARHGPEALEVAASYVEPIHVMVSDVVMPQMSGRELAERLTPLRPEMKVLFMSGYTDDAIVHHGVLDENMPFLQKPFTPIALARKVRDVLDGEKD
ncbi:MAG TPA: PAS domain S-box protein [Pyrinomonadaceae bacterium]|jgi:PAS domain S-box-containing protein|nr:PAS domain S-box protein [Pyrinomonadaceae bacterium]